MHLSYRLIALLGGAAVASIGIATYQAALDVDILKTEVRREAQILAESQQKAVEQMVSAARPRLAASTLSWTLHDVHDPQSAEAVMTASQRST